jgi:hypothetical protein
MHPLNQPEVMISNAASRFEDHGKLVDQTTIDLISRLLENLVAWTRLQPETVTRM